MPGRRSRSGPGRVSAEPAPAAAWCGERGDRSHSSGGVGHNDADPAALTTATIASIQVGLLVTQVRRDPRQLRIALRVRTV